MKVEALTSRDQLKAIGQWLPAAVRRFGASGFGRTLETPPTPESLAARVGAETALYTGMIQGSSAGLIIVEHSPWEAKVVGHPMARVIFLGADTYEGALALLEGATAEMRRRDVVLGRGGSGNSPGHIQAAFVAAGFYFASQVLTLSADIETVWRKLSRLPECKTCRFATPDDAEAMAHVADGAFTESRLVSDPNFPRDWGNRIYMEWARAMAKSDEHRMVVLEQDGRIVAFGNIQRDVTKAPTVPGLFAVACDAQGAGIGPLVLRRIIQEYREAKCDYPLIATEKSNTAINALYFRLGYRIENVNVIYHWTPRR